MSKYTILEDLQVEAKIQSDIDMIVSYVDAHVTNIYVIILNGGFGRGEGTVRFTDGEPHPINDYDLLVIAEAMPALEVEKISEILARKIGIDYVDVSVWPPQWLQNLPLTIFNYELIYGSQVVYGPADFLQQLPPLTADDIPLCEALTLLMNRMGSVLGKYPLILDSEKLSAKQKEYVSISIHKVLLACGDALLLLNGQYHYSYRERRSRLKSLSEQKNFSGLLGGDFHLVDFAYAQKLFPDKFVFDNPVQTVSCCFPMVEKIFLSVAGAMGGCSYSNVLSAVQSEVLKTGKKETTLIQRITNCIRNNFFNRNGIEVNDYDIIYACIVLVFFSSPKYKCNRRLLKQPVNLLKKHFGIKLGAGSYEEMWEQTREIVFSKWKGLFHPS